MEKTQHSTKDPDILFETKDYAVEIVMVDLKDAPHPSLLRKYAIFRKGHKVVAGLSEQFAGAIEAARNLQAAEEIAVAGEEHGFTKPPIPSPPRGFGSGNPPPQPN